MAPSNETHEQQPHLFSRPLEHCPSCHSTNLVPVVDGNTVHFLCVDCARCWNVELAFVHRVNPNTCARCEHYERCARVYAADHR